MFDIGMTELLLIGIVALIVVGPKDLPGLFRTLGRFTAKARSLGKEFTRAMNDAADESGFKEAADGLKAVSNPKKFGLDKLNDAASNFEKWDPTKPSGKADAEDEPKIADPALEAEKAERAKDMEKIRAATEKMGRSKLEREKAAAEAGEADTSGFAKAAADTKARDAAAAEAKTAKKAPAKKAPAKKPAAKKAPAKTPAKSTAKAASKTTSKAATKTPAKKPAASKSPAKSTAKKPAAKKAPAKKAASE